MEHRNAMQIKDSRTYQDDVFFTVAQLQYLESLFPHVAHSASASEATMRHYFGQQSVVDAVRNKTRGLNGRTISTGNIPTP